MGRLPLPAKKSISTQILEARWVTVSTVSSLTTWCNERYRWYVESLPTFNVHSDFNFCLSGAMRTFAPQQHLCHWLRFSMRFNRPCITLNNRKSHGCSIGFGCRSSKWPENEELLTLLDVGGLEPLWERNSSIAKGGPKRCEGQRSIEVPRVCWMPKAASLQFLRFLHIDKVARNNDQDPYSPW